MAVSCLEDYPQNVYNERKFTTWIFVKWNNVDDYDEATKDGNIQVSCLSSFFSFFKKDKYQKIE